MILSFKNMLSFGNNEEYTIDFTQPIVTQFYGENGLGKSNVLKLLKMATYFDYPAKIEKLVNDHQEEGYIQIIHKGYIIKHSFNRKKLVSLVVSDSDGDIDTGGVSSTKAYISKHIFTMDKNVFYNIYCPSIDNFKSFIGMSAEDSRKIRDELFSLTSLNMKLEEQRKQNALIQKDIDILQSNKDIKIEDLERTKTKLEEAKEKHSKNIQQTLEKLEGEIFNLKKEEEQTIEDIEKNLSHILFLDKREALQKLEEYSEEEGKLEEEKKNIERIIESLDGAKMFEKATELKEDISSIKEDISSHEANLEHVEKSLEAIQKIKEQEKYRKYGEEIEALKTKIKEDQKELKICKETREEHLEKYDSLKKTLANIEENIKKVQTKIDSKNLGDECPTCLQPIKLSQEDINLYHNEIVSMEENREETKKNLEILKSENKVNKTKLKITEENLIQKQTRLSFLESAISEIQVTSEKIQTPEEDLETLKDKREKLKNDLEKLKQNLSIKKQTLEEIGEVKQSDFKYDEEKYKNHQNEYQNIKVKILSIKEKAQEKTQDIQDISSRIGDQEDPKLLLDKQKTKEILENKKDKRANLKTLINQKESEIIEVKKQDKTDLIKHISNTIEELEEQLQDIDIRLSSKKEEYDIGIASEFVLSDKGIKKWHLDKIRKSFSASINQDLIDFNLAVRFNEDFSITIYKSGKELDQGLMSLGQKKITDTIICLNFILLYNKKHPDIKISFMDECMSNLSKKNANLLMRKIREILVGKGFSYAFVNHMPLDKSLCERQYEMIDKSTYTEMKEII